MTKNSATRTSPMFLAPAWEIERWFNTERPLSVASLRGRVILVHAFQMLCPGCVARGIPQAMRAATMFEDTDVAVVGLHTVFEHHAAMKPHALEAFLHEYKINFPVGVDMAGPNGDRLPRTMKAYEMRGTPTTILIDRQGHVRSHVFGAHEDMMLGAEIAALLTEDAPVEKPGEGEASKPSRAADDAKPACDTRCPVS